MLIIVQRMRLNSLSAASTAHNVDASTPPLLPSSSGTSSVKTRAPRTNWFSPARWVTIDNIARLNGFRSAQDIVNQLKRGISGKAYTTLNKGTLSRWIDSRNCCWSAETLEKVRLAAGCAERQDAPHIVKSGAVIGRPSVQVRIY